MAFFPPGKKTFSSLAFWKRFFFSTCWFFRCSLSLSVLEKKTCIYFVCVCCVFPFPFGPIRLQEMPMNSVSFARYFKNNNKKKLHVTKSFVELDLSQFLFILFFFILSRLHFFLFFFPGCSCSCYCRSWSCWRPTTSGRGGESCSWSSTTASRYLDFF